MSEEIPPRPPSEPPGWRPNFWAMFVLGLAFPFICLYLCSFTPGNPVMLQLGGLVALVSLFFQGYRGLFVGTFTTLGLVFLTVIVICGSSPRPMM
jgi:hypothetical protein